MFLNRANGNLRCEWLAIWDTYISLRDFPCVYPLQETDNWKVIEMEVEIMSFTVVIMVRQPFCAVTMEEGMALGAKDFLIGGDIGIEAKLDVGSQDTEGSDSVNWYGTYGLVCRGDGEDEITCDQKLRWLQQLTDFDWSMTRTWAGTDDPGECHTWRAWRSRIRKKHIDCVTGPRDLQSATWYLNKTRLRTWDHFSVVVRVNGKKVRVKKGKMAGRVTFPNCGENDSSKN